MSKRLFNFLISIIFILSISLAILNCSSNQAESYINNDHGIQSEIVSGETNKIIQIKGKWADDYGSILKISDAEIISSFDGEIGWKADIVYFDNEKWNGNEKPSGNGGFVVIKYTLASNYQPHSQNKFNIIRWDNFTGDTMEYSEGFKGGSEAQNMYIGTYFDSIEDAKKTATDNNEFFSFFSKVNLIKE